MSSKVSFGRAMKAVKYVGVLLGALLALAQVWNLITARRVMLHADVEFADLV